MKKTNKPIAGYHLLMLLSAVDYKFHIEEEKVIREYLEEEFPFPMNFDAEMDIIANLAPSEWKKHFEFQAQCFYDDSFEDEREQFKTFAKKLIKANQVVSPVEHEYYMLMKKTWKMA